MFISDILGWWYGTGFKDLSNRFKKTFESTVDFFSIDILLKSLFQPFRQTLTSSPIKRTLGQKVGDALISRAVGFTVRFCLIMIGGGLILVELFVICLLMLLWPLLPFSPAILLILSFLKVGF
jgi:hypothetical protein